MGAALKLAKQVARELDLRDLRRHPAANDNFEFDPTDVLTEVFALGEAAPAVLFLFPMWAAASAYLKDPQHYLNKRPATCDDTSPEERRRPLEWSPFKRFAPSHHEYRNPQLSDEDRQKLLEWVSTSKQRGTVTSPSGIPQGLPHDPKRDDTQTPPPDFRNAVIDMPRLNTLPAIEHALPDLQQDDIKNRLMMGDTIPGREYSIGDFFDAAAGDKVARDFLAPVKNAAPADAHPSWIPDIRMQDEFSPLSTDEVLETLSTMKSDEGVSASLLLHAQRCITTITAGWESEPNTLTPAHQLTLPYFKMPWIPMQERAMLLELISVTAWKKPAVEPTLIELLKAGGYVGDFATRIREIYRSNVPHADRALALVDQYTNEQSVRFRKLGGARPVEEVGTWIALKRTISAEQMHSLLLQGDKSVQWLKANIKLTNPKGRFGGRDYERMMSDVLARPSLLPETKILIFGLVHENYSIAPTVQELMQSERDPIGLARQVRDLYEANAPLGTVILADYNRRRTNPLARAREMVAALEKDKTVGKMWRTFLFKLQGQGLTPLAKSLMERGLMYIDQVDSAQNVAIAHRWVTGIANAPKSAWDQLRQYDAANDLSGYRAAVILNELSYDGQKDPLGFLLPHERTLWERDWDSDHPSHDLLMRMASRELRDADDIIVQYEGLLRDGVLEDALRVLRDALQGEIEGVNPAHLRELMRRAAVEPAEQVSLMYWAGMTAVGRSYIDVPARAVSLLEEARLAGADLVGNVTELMMRHNDVGSMAEVQGIRHYLKPGNWIHILPRNFSTYHFVADMVVTDDMGLQDTVEIKTNHYYGRPEDVERLQRGLKKAARQLRSSSKVYPFGRRVIFLRLVTDNGSGVPTLAREAILHQLATEEFEKVAKVTVVVGRVNSKEAPAVETIANPKYSDLERIRGSGRVAGPRKARVLVERLVRLGIVDLASRNDLVSKLSQADAGAVTMVAETIPTVVRMQEALERYGLLQTLRP